MGEVVRTYVLACILFLLCTFPISLGREPLLQNRF